MNGGRESHSACVPDFAIVSALSIRNLRCLLICHTVAPLCCGIGGLHIKNLVLGWLRTVFYFDAIIRKYFVSAKENAKKYERKFYPCA